LSSSQATGGRLKEAFRGGKEIRRFVADKGRKVESVVVHRIPPIGGFDIFNSARRVLYAWTGGIEIIAASERYVLDEDEKIFISPDLYGRFTVGNGSGSPGFVVEVCSSPFYLANYFDICEKRARHFPALRSSEELEHLEARLEQITVHTSRAYDVGGNHCHLPDSNGIVKDELFVVVDGSLHTFEELVFKREGDVEGFGNARYEWYEAGGSFVFKAGDTDSDNLYWAHATVAGAKGARFAELSSVAFDPEHFRETMVPYVIVPKTKAREMLEAASARQQS
jgi:hypothetical protein